MLNIAMIAIKVSLLLLLLNQFRGRWYEVLPVEEVRSVAEDCLDRYRIRSADALQLGESRV